MSLPDPLTIAEILGETSIAGLIICRVHQTERLIDDISTGDSRQDWDRNTTFVVSRSRRDYYGAIALPLGFLGVYLGLYALAGFPTWESPSGLIEPNLYIPGSIFFLAITLLPSFALTVRRSSEFYVVSASGLERRKGKKVAERILWDEVRLLDVSDDSSLPAYISIASEHSKILVDARIKSIKNRDLLCAILLDKTPGASVTGRFRRWVARKYPSLGKWSE